MSSSSSFGRDPHFQMLAVMVLSQLVHGTRHPKPSFLHELNVKLLRAVIVIFECSFLINSNCKK